MTQTSSPVPLLHLAALSRCTRILPGQNIKSSLETVCERQVGSAGEATGRHARWEVQIVVCNCLNLYHRSPYSGERQFKSGPWKRRFDPPRSHCRWAGLVKRLVDARAGKFTSSHWNQLSDTRVSEPHIQARLGTTAHLWKGVVLNLRTVSNFTITQNGP